VNIFFCLEKQKVGLFVCHLEILRLPQFGNHWLKTIFSSLDSTRYRAFFYAFSNNFRNEKHFMECFKLQIDSTVLLVIIYFILDTLKKVFN